MKQRHKFKSRFDENTISVLTIQKSYDKNQNNILSLKTTNLQHKGDTKRRNKSQMTVDYSKKSNVIL